MSLKEKDLEAERIEKVPSKQTIFPPPYNQSNISPRQIWDDEKPHGGRDGGLDVQHVLDRTNNNENPDLPTAPPEREDKETRRIIRKVDFRLLPTLAAIYAFALIDRVNLPNVSGWCLFIFSVVVISIVIIIIILFD